MKFRKKPIVIDAMLWTGEVGAATGYEDVLGWLTLELVPYRVNDMGDLIIPTLEGDMSAARGDWIIRGVAGEFYPCKPDIFAATYEPAPLVEGEQG